MIKKNIRQKFMIAILCISSLCIQTINAYNLDTEMYVELETYNLEDNCKYGSKVYTFTITSKDNIFKQYNNVNRSTITLSTKLDTVHPSSAYAKNKSIIKFNVYESDLKKIFKQDTLKISYGHEIFDDNTLRQKFKQYNQLIYYSPLFIKAYTNLSINKKNLKTHINNCKYEYNIYKEKEKKRNLKRKKERAKELKKKNEAARVQADKQDLIWLH